MGIDERAESAELRRLLSRVLELVDESRLSCAEREVVRMARGKVGGDDLIVAAFKSMERLRRQDEDEFAERLPV